MLARDQGSPQQTGTATVTVNVERNDYAPEFSDPDAEVTIAGTFTPSLTVMEVKATDRDEEVRVITVLYH